MLPGAADRVAEFPQNDEIALFAEVYDNAGNTPHKVDITATVTADEGKVMLHDEGRHGRAKSCRATTGGYGYTTKIPLRISRRAATCCG